jgi:hypothetical protein
MLLIATLAALPASNKCINKNSSMYSWQQALVLVSKMDFLAARAVWMRFAASGWWCGMVLDGGAIFTKALAVSYLLSVV